MREESGLRAGRAILGKTRSTMRTQSPFSEDCTPALRALARTRMHRAVGGSVLAGEKSERNQSDDSTGHDWDDPPVTGGRGRMNEALTRIGQVDESQKPKRHSNTSQRGCGQAYQVTSGHE